MTDDKKKPDSRIASLEDVTQELSRIADSGEGSERTTALRLLKDIYSGDASTITIPPPIDYKEAVERLARLMAAYPKDVARKAFFKAFGVNTKDLHEVVPEIGEFDIDWTQHPHLPQSLRALYRRFPEMKKSGQPRGYPVRGSDYEKAMFVKGLAKRAIIGREQAKLRQQLTEEANQVVDYQREALDITAPTEGTDGAPPS